MKSRNPTTGKHKFINMSPEQKELLLAKLAEAKAKVKENKPEEAEVLIDEAAALASEPDPKGGDT